MYGVPNQCTVGVSLDVGVYALMQVYLLYLEDINWPLLKFLIAGHIIFIMYYLCTVYHS